MKSLSRSSARHQRFDSLDHSSSTYSHQYHPTSTDSNNGPLDNNSRAPTSTPFKPSVDKSSSGKGASRIKEFSFLSNHHTPSALEPRLQPSYLTLPTGEIPLHAFFQLHHGTMHSSRITHEDWLQKRSTSMPLVWKQRWCVLRNDCLFYYRTKTESKPLGVLHLLHHSILISGLDISRKSSYAFRLSSTESITHEQQHHHFRTENAHTLEIWLEAIKSNIDHAQEQNDTFSSPDIDGSGRAERYQDQGYNSHERSELTIIDKVLERLQLDEDPTLSDMNDPSTLIMPAQEHSSLYQHPIPPPFTTQRSHGHGLGEWSPSPSSASALYSPTSSIHRPIGNHEADSCRSGSSLHSRSREHSVASSWATTPVTDHSSYTELGGVKSSDSALMPDRHEPSGIFTGYTSMSSRTKNESYTASIPVSPPISPETIVSRPRSIQESDCINLPIWTFDSYLGDLYPSSETETDTDVVQTLATGGSNRLCQKSHGIAGGRGRYKERDTRNSTRRRSGKPGSLGSLEYSDDDKFAMQSHKLEEMKSATLPNERKPRWFWPVPSTVSQPPPSSSLEKTSKRAFDADNPILRSLVLISPPPSRSVTKVSRHQSGSSNTLTAPNPRLESEPSSRYHQQQQEQDLLHQQQCHSESLPPIHLGANGSIQSLYPRTRSTSVSKLDKSFHHRTFQGVQRPHQQQRLNNHRQPSVGDILASQPLYSQLSLSNPSSQKCTDQGLVTGFPVGGSPYFTRHQEIVSRHIVAPVELAKAIEQDEEVERERGLDENLDKTIKTITVTTPIPTETEEATTPSLLRSSSTAPPVVPRRSPFRSVPIDVIDSFSRIGNTTSTFPF